MAKAKKRTTSASRIVFNRFYKGRPEKQADLEQALADSALGVKIYQLRVKAGLSQQRLAELIGTQASAISRIEDADYDGHSVETLRRIAKALNARLRIDFVPTRKSTAQKA